MLTSDLVTRYPTLFHMAEDGSWPSILRHGLLSTSALLSLYNYQGSDRFRIESEWREEKVLVRREGLADAVIRDQKPMPPCVLSSCLAGITTRQWYHLINGKVFFWLKHEDLEMFLAAKEYRNHPHVVIVVDTGLLMKHCGDHVTLSGINTGSTLSNPPPARGPNTFQTVSRYGSPFVRELCVDEAIPRISDVTIDVYRMIAHRLDFNTPPKIETLAKLWP
jgi:hypothetical protein